MGKNVKKPSLIGTKGVEIGKKLKMAEIEIFIHQKSALESLKVSRLIPLNIASYGLVEHIPRKPVEKASVIGDR